MGTSAARRVWAAFGAVGAVAAVLAGVASGGLPGAGAQATGPEVTVSPATDLVDGSRVTITVSGATPNGWVEAAQCPADVDQLWEDCDTRDGAWGQVDGTGSATLSLRVDAVVTGGYDDPVETDCRRPEACVVGVAVEADGLSGTAPLHFDPDAPLSAPPTISVHPDDQLADLQAVTVSGSGFVWSDRASVIQCASNPVVVDDDCDYTSEVTVDVDDTGSFTHDIPAQAVIDTPGRGPIDCRQPVSCALAVTQVSPVLDPAKSAVVPLGFDPDTEVTPPVVTVAPDTDLVDGQTVRVEGQGFAGQQFLQLSVCAPASAPPGCEWIGYADTDAEGRFATDVRVYALVYVDPGDPTAGIGQLDCRRAEDPCQLVATPSSPTSPRAGRADLHFDPEGPLAPGPEIEVDPATDLPEEATVTVTGRGFTPDAFGNVRVCAVGRDEACDQGWVSLEADAEGDVTVEISAAARFVTDSGEPVDCRVAPGCEVVAQQESERPLRASAGLSFAPAGGGNERYLDPVFGDVEVTRDVVYRETVDAAGQPVTLRLDVYEPAGDTASERPAVVWMHGGWYADGGKGDMAAYAEAFARRGYVAVSLDYRLRPGLACCPTDDVERITDAILDGSEDAAAGVAWLREHADDYRIDPDAIAAGGISAGATNAFSLANLPDDGHGGDGGHGGHGHEAAMARPGSADDDGHDHGSDESRIAAALPISGVSLGRHEAGEVPVLAFHGTTDQTAPQHLSDWTCEAAHQVDVRCDVVGYAGLGHDIATTRQHDIVGRSTDFLAEVVLEPRGYLPGNPSPGPSSTTTTTTHHHSTTTTTSRRGTTTTTSPAHSSTTTTTAGGGGGSGSGSDHGDDTDGSDGSGTGRLARTGSNVTGLLRLGLALTALGALLLLAARHHRLGWVRPGRGRGHVVLATLGVLFAALVVPGSGSAVEGAGSRGVELVASGEASTGTAGGAVSGTTAAEEPWDGGAFGLVAAVAGAGDEPHHDFPEEWTPEQVAYAEALIADTEAALARYRYEAILPLAGYMWISDGIEPGSYRHWTYSGRIGDGHILDPERPESLVVRNTGNGGALEAVMFILDFQHTMDNIPAEIAWLPGWHEHRNLCFDNQFRIVGLAVDGVCEHGFLYIPPPMMHVWIVDTPCGRFAGVDEHGLQCDHEPHVG